MTAKELRALADRCEAATGPDTTIDAKISYAIVVKDWEKHDPRWDSYTWPAYTASLDAALTLVPGGRPWEEDGWHWSLNNHEGMTTHYDGEQDNSRPWRCAMGSYIEVDAATPALALTAAALRARALFDGGEDATTPEHDTGSRKEGA